MHPGLDTISQQRGHVSHLKDVEGRNKGSERTPGQGTCSKKSKQETGALIWGEEGKFGKTETLYTGWDRCKES